MSRFRGFGSLNLNNEIFTQVIYRYDFKPRKIQLPFWREHRNVSNISQLVVFERYVKDDKIKADILFCKPVTKTTKAVDVKKLVDDFFRENLS